MGEKLNINNRLSMVLEMFNMADKCTNAEAGRLFLLNIPDTVLDDKKAKAKDVKRKGPAVLAAEPKKKHGCDRDEPVKEGCLFCVYHNVHTTTPLISSRSRCSVTSTCAIALTATTTDSSVEAGAVEAAGIAPTPSSDGVTSLAMEASMISLATTPGAINSVRNIFRTMQAFRCSQGGTTTTSKTRGLGATWSLTL